MNKALKDIVKEVEELKNECPHCGSLDLNLDIKLEGISAFAPNWVICNECSHMFMQRKTYKMEEKSED